MPDDESYEIKLRGFDEIGFQESKNDIQSKEVEANPTFFPSLLYSSCVSCFVCKSTLYVTSGLRSSLIWVASISDMALPLIL
jgi:hypothetical protein